MLAIALLGEAYAIVSAWSRDEHRDNRLMRMCIKPPGCESYSNHADGSPVTAEEHTDMNRRKKEQCQRLYQLLGDRTLTPQQVEAIRVSMNAHFCAGLVP